MSGLRAIVFDMDGVLLDSEPYILRAGQRMILERYGVEVPAEAFHPFVGRGEDAYLGGAAASYGVQLQLPEDKNYTYEIYLETIRNKLKALDGVMPFIDAMESRGVVMAIFSSADRMKVEGNLREIGLAQNSFKVILTGSDVTHKKPHPEGYARAVEILGVPAHETLVIEDAISGVEAGCAAGCRCLGITSSVAGPRLKNAGAEWVAKNLSDVPEVLLREFILME